MYNIKQLENVNPTFPSRVYSKEMVKGLRILGHSTFTIVVNKNEKVEENYFITNITGQSRRLNSKLFQSHFVCLD